MYALQLCTVRVRSQPLHFLGGLKTVPKFFLIVFFCRFRNLLHGVILADDSWFVVSKGKRGAVCLLVLETSELTKSKSFFFYFSSLSLKKCDKPVYVLTLA